MLRGIDRITCTFILIGMALIAIAFYDYAENKSFISRAAKTEGIVIDILSSPGIKMRAPKNRTLVIRFFDRQCHEILFSESDNSSGYSIGESVDVLYDPASPKKPKTNRFITFWGGATVVGGMGIVFFLLGVGIILVANLPPRNSKLRKRKRNAQPRRKRQDTNSDA
jgi:hypothetical protein